MTTSNVSAGRWVRRGGEIILFPAQFQAEGPEQEFGAGATPFVRWVQTMLNLVGGMSLPVSGILDTPTRTGIRQFQQRKGLVADGVVGPRTEAAFVSGGGVPFRLFGTGLPAQVGQPGPWVPRCGGNEVSCMTMTAAEQARVFSKGGTPQGQAQDRTPESAREVKLQVHLSDYDVNDWLVRKPAHKAALDRVIEFIKADPSGKPVEVTISGSASRQGPADVNEALACKRAQCAAWYIRTGLSGHAAEGRVTVDSNGTGFREATCDPLPKGGTECELPRYRSVLVQVHAPGRKPTPIPVIARTAFTIQCLSYELTTLPEWAGKGIEDVLGGAVNILPKSVVDKLKSWLKAKGNGLIARLKKHIKLDGVAKKLDFLLRKIPLQVIKETATFRIAERDRSGTSRSITLCYVGIGIRLDVPVRDLASEILNMVLSKELQKNLGPLAKTLLDIIAEHLGGAITPLVTAGPGAVKMFATQRDAALADFAGPAMMAKDGLTPERVHLGFRSDPFTLAPGPNRITRDPCSDCFGTVIPVPVGPGTRELFAVGEGTLTVANCTSGGDQDTARRFAAPRRLAIPGRLARR